MKINRKIIQINDSLCNGCGLCIPSCPEQALEIIDTSEGPKVKIVKELYCDGLGACLGRCPTGALTIVTRESDPYNETATIARIKEVAPEMLNTHLHHISVSKSTRPNVASCFQRDGSNLKKGAHIKELNSPSALNQWPIQLTLVNPQAPYFQTTDLLITADCVPFAYANFHKVFLTGKSLIIGCPKLDDTELYLNKLTELFKNSNVKNITVINMEVPCCFGLLYLVEEAVKQSGIKIQVDQIVISTQGQIITG